MLRKVSSDWLPSFIKATRPVLEILNMAGFFWDRPCISITSIEGQIHRWKEYLEELLNTSTPCMEREEPASIPTELPLSIRPPSKREIVNAIEAMTNGKAAGADNIPAEVLKADPYMSADILLPLFQDIWQKEKFPKEWKEGIIIKVPKKGDLSQCRNWRGVTLLAVISKIFNKIVLEWIKNSLEMGFGRNRLDSIITGHVLTRSIH
jgi:hypothetical protein